MHTTTSEAAVIRITFGDGDPTRLSPGIGSNLFKPRDARAARSSTIISRKYITPSTSLRYWWAGEGVTPCFTAVILLVFSVFIYIFQTHSKNVHRRRARSTSVDSSTRYGARVHAGRTMQTWRSGSRRRCRSRSSFTACRRALDTLTLLSTTSIPIIHASHCRASFRTSKSRARN